MADDKISDRDLIARALHEYSSTLPDTSQDRALLFSRRYGAADAILSSLAASGRGIMPREPTAKMCNAATRAARDPASFHARESIHAVYWRSMFDAQSE